MASPPSPLPYLSYLHRLSEQLYCVTNDMRLFQYLAPIMALVGGTVEGLRLVSLTQIRLQARHGPVRFMQMMWACVAGCLPFGLGETRFLPSFLWLDIGQEC